MKRLCAALFIVLAAALVPVAAASGAPIGVIEGTLTNGTTGLPLAGAIVGLEVDGAVATTAETDANGLFRFPGLESTATYTPVTAFEGVPYRWDPVTFTPASPTASLELDVFEPTNDPSDISLKTASFVVVGLDAERQRMRLVQFLTFENTGNRAYVGPPTDGRIESVRIRPPDGTLQTDVVGGLGPGDVIESVDSVALSRPLTPGLTDVALAFDVAYSDAAKSMILDFGMAPREAFVLAPEGTVSVGGAALSFDRAVDLQGLLVERYRVAVDGVTSTVSAELGELPLASPPPSPDSDMGRAFAVMAAAASVAAVGLYVLRHRRRPVVATADVETLGRRDALMRDLLDLDANPGSAPADDVEERRRSLLAQIRALQ